MHINAEGIALIKECEGCKLEAYKCAAGVYTIGYGHTKGVKAGMKITKAQAEAYFNEDITKFEGLVNKYAGKYSWTENQYSALVSFAFNIGSIDQLTANGTRTNDVIAKKMLEYNKINGVTSSGLVTRRKKEQALFLKEAPMASIPTQPAGHVQLNYQAGATYTVTASPSLTVRTKPSLANGSVKLGTKLSSLANGSKVKNGATMALNGQIFMYIGLDVKKREQWICADNGSKSYVS